ncbi:AbrB family transcriptional regulator [Lentilactobacillus fungorum]|uniref:AbrB family transcriptional regulator n=1 Tax=Lentilactobacillus fungorum TaxID=2201250 RepID=A0ABQ3W027_9LACO|nr:toxin-antitoxin system [Lentilactobacillus fungorum]GHP14018.1 AbrB family transcriptional regulator [Lentilactobacillus fungorum]
METQTRRQGNSIMLTVPSKFHIGEGVTVKPKLTPDGIFYEFVHEDDDFFNFDKDILKDIVKDKVPAEQIPDEFAKRKQALSGAWKKLIKEAKDSSVMTTREAFEKEVGL